LPQASERAQHQEEAAPARPLIMPALISARPAMEFCGQDTVVRSALGDVGDQEPWECLLEAREAGGAAEVIRDTLTVEGAPTRSIVRLRPSGEIEWWSDATRDPFGSGQWTRSVCGRLETYPADRSVPPVHIPEDCSAQQVLIGSDQEDQPFGDEMAMLEALVLFARTSEKEFLADVPLSADGVWLGLANRLSVRLSPEHLARPRAWRLPTQGFRGHVGPFSALELLADWGRGLAGDSVHEATVSVGPHPHCAAPPVPAPGEVAELRRLSVQPVGAASCLSWWTVDFFVEPGGAIAAITLDLYEP
jgi:hypothetical protein